MKPRFREIDGRTYDYESGLDFARGPEPKWFTSRPVPYHWISGWRDQHRHCMNVSLANARTARKVAPDQIGRYARQAMAHYREARKHERMMEQYDGNDKYRF